MSQRWLKREQPISLRWKWGVLLFLSFFALSMLTLTYYHQYFRREQRQILGQLYEEQFHSIVGYLESYDSLYSTEQNDILQMESQSALEGNRLLLDDTVYHFLQSQSAHDITLRFFNDRNQLIYSTRHIDLPMIERGQQVMIREIEGIYSFIASTPIYSQETGQEQGVLQYVVQSNYFFERENRQFQSFIILSLILSFTCVVWGFLLSRRFLKPLNYLNNSLDLVEEENLSDLRMQQPRTIDEWSDLTVHINRLLDKIDLYVKNQKQFVEDVSHELRTPVAIVEGHLKMLNRWGKEDPEILDEAISASLQEISRMKGLVQEMLDLMRADHAEVDYKDEITEINSTVRQVYNNFVMLYPEFKFYLDVEKNTSEQYIRMFRNHFEQVLIILLDNAVKYSLDRKEIHISVSTTLSEIQIAVQDFGEGMTEEDKSRVFGRFYRVDKARSRDKGGNGLGLSIAQQLVKSYKGTIRVESVVEHGSIFYVTFPIVTDTRLIFKSKKKARYETMQDE